jgi:uncharacterized protein (TIGR03437 family)
MTFRRAVAAAIATGLATVPLALAVPAIGASPAPVVSAVCQAGLARPGCELGPVAGGYLAVISGANFTGTSQVSFGGAQASFTVVSATRINVVVPATTVSPRRVTVRVTTPGGTSAACGRREGNCPAAFFYSGSRSLTGSGANVSHAFSGSAGSVTYSGTMAIASWSLSGQLQSSGRVIPQAILVTGKLRLEGLSVKLTISGDASTELRIPIPVPGLPSVTGLYLRVIPGLAGSATVTDKLDDDTVTMDLGWVNGVGYHAGRVSCAKPGCLSKPALSKQVSGTLVIGPWLQLGPDALNLGAGPAAGLYRDDAGDFDACAAVQAEIKILSVRRVYNLAGPVNLSGTFADCPLA